MIKNKAGRPQKEINWTLFEELCNIQCTQSEIASVLHIHPNTLSDRVLAHYGEDYSNTYKKYSEGGKTSLRRYQFNLAKKNTAMAIWLGKQWLGQRDTEVHVAIPEEIADQFNQFMKQLDKAQSARKSAEINSNNETKS